MVTKTQYDEAVKQQKNAEKIINQYHEEQAASFNERLKNGPAFTDDELIYSAYNLCPCGHGLAYPKGCGAFHYWDCSAILKGEHDKSVEHCAQLPFTTTDIKSENDRRGTTRGMLKPKIGKTQ